MYRPRVTFQAGDLDKRVDQPMVLSYPGLVLGIEGISEPICPLSLLMSRRKSE